MSTAATSTSETSQATQNYRLPHDTTLKHAVKLSIVEDKPLLMDYWTSSIENKCLIGVREGGEKLLVKSEEEYTSPISKFYKRYRLIKTLFNRPNLLLY